MSYMFSVEGYKGSVPFKFPILHNKSDKKVPYPEGFDGMYPGMLSGVVEFRTRNSWKEMIEKSRYKNVWNLLGSCIIQGTEHNERQALNSWKYLFPGDIEKKLKEVGVNTYLEYTDEKGWSPIKIGDWGKEPEEPEHIMPRYLQDNLPEQYKGMGAIEAAKYFSWIDLSVLPEVEGEQKIAVMQFSKAHNNIYDEDYYMTIPVEQVEEIVTKVFNNKAPLEQSYQTCWIKY